jgi:hypothetical protein
MPRTVLGFPGEAVPGVVAAGSGNTALTSRCPDRVWPVGC